MLSLVEKTALQNEYTLLVSANLKKDGAPKKKANPLALARIAEIIKIAHEQNQIDANSRREERKNRELAFVQQCGFSIGQKVKFTVLGKAEIGIITPCVNLPCQLNSGFLEGQIGVSIAGSMPYMFDPKDLQTV